jgi:hypothetical protein
MNYRDETETLRAENARLIDRVAELEAALAKQAMKQAVAMKPPMRWTPWDKQVLALLIISVSLRAGLIAACGFKIGDIAWGAATLATIVIWLSLRQKDDR